MAITQINLNANPLTSGVIQIALVTDPNYPGVSQAAINADPLTPGVIQANINWDPLTPGIQYIHLIGSVSSGVTGIPVNTSIPTISGVPQVGQTLTATNGSWTQFPTSFAYQWNDELGSIAGATDSTYIPVVGDIGDQITVSVTAINVFGSSAPATSAPTGAVIPAGGGMFNQAAFSSLLVPVGLAS
jgi:hypothetical protein